MSPNTVANRDMPSVAVREEWLEGYEFHETIRNLFWTV